MAPRKSKGIGRCSVCNRNVALWEVRTAVGGAKPVTGFFCSTCDFKYVDPKSVK